jgi:lysophospholipase L1-like esterase
LLDSTKAVPARRTVRALVGLAGVLVTAAGVLLMPVVGAASADPLPPRPFPTLSPFSPPPTFPGPLLPVRATVFGESYTSGEGAGNGLYPTIPGTADEDWRHQSPYAPFHLAWAYLELNRRPLLPSYTVTPYNFLTSWGPDHLTFLPSSGAETTHLDHPLMDGSTVKSRPMLDHADPDSDLVFFGLGGNDAGFGDLVRTTLYGFFEGVDRNVNNPMADWREIQTFLVNGEVQRLRKGMPGVATKVTQALEKTHAKMQKAQIVVSLYPLVVKPNGNADIPYVAGSALDAMYPFVVALNEAVLNGAIQFAQQHPNVGVHIYDPNTAGDGGLSLVAGHELGQPGSYFNGVVRRNQPGLSMFHQLQESFHPNQLGTVAMGKGLAKYLADTFPQWYGPSMMPDGLDYNKVIVNPQPNPNELTAVGSDPEFEDWARTDPDRLCEGVQPESLCGNFLQDPDLGLVIPVDQVFLRPGSRPGTWVTSPDSPGGPPYPGGGGGSGGGESGGCCWTSVGYPAPSINTNNPCAGIIFFHNVPVNFISYPEGSRGRMVEQDLAGGLPPHELVLQGTPCRPVIILL